MINPHTGSIDYTIALEAGGAESSIIVGLAIGGDRDAKALAHEPVGRTGFTDLIEPVPIFAPGIRWSNGVEGVEFTDSCIKDESVIAACAGEPIMSLAAV